MNYVLNNTIQLTKLISELRALDLSEPYTVAVKRKREKRSLNQNNYYWGVVLETISKDTGYTPDELHKLFLELYLQHKVEYKEVLGIQIADPASTTKLTTQEMEGYLGQIRVFASTELGIFVPLPNEVPPSE